MQDGIARYITAKDVSDIPRNKDKLARVMTANGMISRLRSTIAKSEVAHHHRLRLIAEFKEAVVEAALQRKGSPEKRDLETIAAAFAKEIADLVNGEVNHAAKPEPADQITDNNIDGRFVTYNDDGQVSGVGRTHLASKGFKVGDFVKPRKADNWTIYKVREISEEGNVDVNPVDKMEGTVNQSELTTIDRKTFCTDWVTSRCTIEIMEEFPKYDAINDVSMPDFTLKHLVTSCMEELIKRHPTPALRIYKSPHNIIVAMEAFANGELVLVPGTKVITIQDDDAQQSSSESSKTVVAIAENKGFKLQPYTTDKKFVCPFWYVTVKHEREKCNLELQNRFVNTRRPTANDKNTSPIIPVAFPCAVNFTAIAKHAELVLYRPGVQAKQEKREAPLVLRGTAKKPKASV